MRRTHNTRLKLLMMNHARAFAALIPPLQSIDDCWSPGERARTRKYASARPPLGMSAACTNSKLVNTCFPRSVGLNVPDGMYVIVKRLPERDGEFEYQIKNLAEPDERVVRESQLRPSPWHRSGRPARYRQ